MEWRYEMSRMLLRKSENYSLLNKFVNWTNPKLRFILKNKRNIYQ